mmetsp:Transcript_18275/g.20442  ORF Transcript_18275/g.20442 Transcript_18275/m.20442 type:complete len:139 (+) Transcript_18275:1802-2218(+)
MEAVKLKQGLAVAMKISTLCNGYFQETEPFKIFKTDFNRCSTVVNIALNALKFLCLTLEPFVPSFCAKIYEQLNLTRTVEDDQLIGELRDQQSKDNFSASTRLLAFLKEGQVINKPSPVFKLITEEQIEQWRDKFNGK